MTPANRVGAGRPMFTAKERHMLLVALDCVVIEYKQTQRRAERNGNLPNLAAMAEDAVKRYTKLANKVAAHSPKPRKRA